MVGGHTILGWSEKLKASIFDSSDALSTDRAEVMTSRAVALLRV